MNKQINLGSPAGFKSKSPWPKPAVSIVVAWWRHKMHTVYPKKYAHGFCFAVLCCGYTLTDFPISTRLTSLALWQSNDCPSASKATLMNMDKYFMWIHNERLHNHNKEKHNKTVCIFLGIYCTCMYLYIFVVVVLNALSSPENNFAKTYNARNHIFVVGLSNWNCVLVPKARLWAHVYSLSLKFSWEVRFLQYTHFERIFWWARETLAKHSKLGVTGTRSPAYWISTHKMTELSRIKLKTLPVR